MSSNIIRIIITGVLFIIMSLFGIWLSNSGTPYNIVLLSVHKILALLTAIAIIVTMIYLLKGVEIKAFYIILIIVSGIIFLISFVSGVLLTFDKPVSALILNTHKITSIVTAISTVLMIFLATRLIKS